MNRLLVFMLGIAVGAAGMYVLYWSDKLPVRPPPVVAQAPVRSSAPGVGAQMPPAPSEPETLPAPSVSVAGASPTEVIPPVPLPTPEPAAASSVEAADANASEESVPTTPEAAAAVTAANATGALLIPVQGVQAAKLVDTFTQSRGAGRLHDAIDIMAARGTPVLAAADGRVVKLFNSKPGGTTVYQFDREEKLAYYYAHLDRYADGLAEGKVLKRGEVIGYVGSTGNASPDAPHLHFAVFVLGPEKHWWQGVAVNPYPLLGGR
jgi:murein DD-endopeptidase MepM/ murein hydrolase activator NlpD